MIGPGLGELGVVQRGAGGRGFYEEEGDAAGEGRWRAEVVGREREAWVGIDGEGMAWKGRQDMGGGACVVGEVGEGIFGGDEVEECGGSGVMGDDEDPGWGCRGAK